MCGPRPQPLGMSLRKWLALSLALNVLGLACGAYAVKRMGGWRYMAHRLHTIHAWPGITQRQSQLELLPIDYGTTVLLGDSHLAHGEWHDWLPDERLLNRGVSAMAVKHVRAFAKKLPLHRASAVVVQAGTNDLLFVDAGAALAGYEAFVDELIADASGAALVLCTVPGVNNEVRWTGIDPAEVVRYNDGVRDLAAKRGLGLCDLARTLGSVDGVLPAYLTDDGVHLRGEGYQIWASTLREALPGGTTLAAAPQL